VRRAAVLLVFALLAWSCGGCGAKKMPQPDLQWENATQIRPLQQYRVWFIEASMCSYTVGYPFEAIEWYLVDDVELVSELGPPPSAEAHIAGFYSKGKIYLKRGHELDKRVVKHELLHAMGFQHWHMVLWACSEK
jgi:hypothetical protein